MPKNVRARKWVPKKGDPPRNLRQLRKLIRFYSRRDPRTGCIEWTGGRQTFGYGQVYYRGIKITAHRLVYQLKAGPTPRGFYVCHRCDNPPCINHKHLFLGTPRDNNIDCVKKGRHVPGKGTKRAAISPQPL